MKRWMGLLGLVFFSAQAPAAEILWLELTPWFTYRDLSTACSNSNGFLEFILPRPLYLAMELDGKTTVVRATLHNRISKNPGDLPAKSIAFLPAELANIKLHRDKKDRVWIKEFLQSARLLNWIFFENSYLEGCEPSATLKTLGPAPYQYQFNVDSMGDLDFSSDSQIGKFSGTLNNGAPYEATLGFTEKQYFP